MINDLNAKSRQAITDAKVAFQTKITRENELHATEAELAEAIKEMENAKIMADKENAAIVKANKASQTAIFSS